MDTQPTPGLTPGKDSTEYGLTRFVTYAGVLFGAVVIIGGGLLDSGLAMPPWLRAVVGLAGVGGAVAASMGYRKSRSLLKLEGLKSTVTPMLPQLLQVANQVKDLVNDIKAGGLTAPADDPSTPPALQTPSPAGGATSMPLQLATVAVKAVLPDSPIATAIAGAAEQVAEKAGAAAAAKVTDAQKAADVFNSTKP